MDEMALIALNDISKRYCIGEQDVCALNSVDMTIAKNEFIAIVGASGSGKSTLMYILGCLDKPTSGDYYLEGNKVCDLTESELSDLRNQKIGFVFQNFNLIPNLSALHNTLQPLIYRRIPNKKKIEMARHELDRLGLSNRENHLPGELSGGQRQRVAIARALVTKPSLILADEPTGNLDSKTSADVMRCFDELHDEGETVVIVTHDDKIANHCQRRITLVDGQIVPGGPNE